MRRPRTQPAVPPPYEKPKPVGPQSLAEAIAVINEEGLAEIVSESIVEGRESEYVYAITTLVTKTGKRFSIEQELDLKPTFKSAKLVNWTSGSGEVVDTLEKGR